MFPVEPPAGKPPAPHPSVEPCRGLGETTAPRTAQATGPGTASRRSTRPVTVRPGTASRRSTRPVTVRPGTATGVACRPADGRAGLSGSLLPGLARLGGAPARLRGKAARATLLALSLPRRRQQLHAGTVSAGPTVAGENHGGPEPARVRAS